MNYFLPLIVSSYEPDVDVILDRRDLKGEEDEDDDEAEFLVREDPASVYLPRSSLDLSDESNEHGMMSLQHLTYFIQHFYLDAANYPLTSFQLLSWGCQTKS